MKTILTTERVDAWFADLRDDIKTALALARELLEKTMALKLRKWDTAEHLKTEEEMALYLEACLAEAGDDATFIAKALGDIARAKGMTQLAKETGLGDRACTRHFPARAIRVLPPSSR